MVKVKICGITNFEDALLCEELGADALGFIFYDKSERYIDPQLAKDIIKRLLPFTIKVGVFVNVSTEKINSISKSIGLNIVQLHGDEPQNVLSEIDLPVIKAFRIKQDFEFNIFNQFTNCSFLLDTYSDSIFGGTGKTFDWNLIPEHYRNKIILSGGVSSSNIQEIISKIKPYAVDVSSSLEEYPGKKSAIKVIDFFYNLKGTK
ncbi:MAG TPA: phosphoribosylanthranilate isomerase [Ignavibacteriales bacterium]|nr:phosphoribosylanthranilate isomerase [Ignavibacteriales bacterium]